MKLTVVFYENPAALAEINFWESTMQDKIKTKECENDDIIFSLEDEMLWCTPVDKPSIEKIFTLLKNNVAFYYHKTLMFGRLNSKLAVDLSYYISKLELLCTHK